MGSSHGFLDCKVGFVLLEGVDKVVDFVPQRCINFTAFGDTFSSFWVENDEFVGNFVVLHVWRQGEDALNPAKDIDFVRILNNFDNLGVPDNASDNFHGRIEGLQLYKTISI